MAGNQLSAMVRRVLIEAEKLTRPSMNGTQRYVRGLLEALHKLNPDVPLEDYLGEVEKQAILQTLEETRWNRTAAAKKLGMTLRSLRYRLSKLGLD